MSNPWRWGKAVLARSERLPLVGSLQSSVRKGLLLGASVGALSFLLVGGVLGGLSRGAMGVWMGAAGGCLAGVMLGGVVGAIFAMGRLPQKGSPVVSIELDTGDGRVKPGENVTGCVRITGKNTFRTSGGKVYLVCRGFYAYDRIGESEESDLEFARESRQYLVEEAKVIPPGRLRRGASHRHPFRFTLSNLGPPTHHGYVCSVRWTLHAVLEAPDMPSIMAHRELFLEAAPPFLEMGHREYQSVVSTQVGQLVLSLSRAVYAEGEKLHGHVRVTASRSFGARGIRAVLLRIENLSAGDDHFVYVTEWDPTSGLFRGERRPGGKGTTYVWLEDEIQLSGLISFGASESVTLPFELHVPTAWRPTLSTDCGKVTWKVGIVVSRSSHSDLRVFHEVIVHTEAGNPGSHDAGQRSENPALQQEA